jgi:hypothetical protein
MIVAFKRYVQPEAVEQTARVGKASENAGFRNFGRLPSKLLETLEIVFS